MIWPPLAPRAPACLLVAASLAVATAHPATAQEPSQPAAQRLVELRRERDALTPQQRRSLLTGEVDALLDAYVAAAKVYREGDAGPFLIDALELASERRAVRNIANLIAADFSASPSLDALGPVLPTLKTRCGVKAANDLFTKLERDTPSPRLRAWAVLARLETILRSAKPGTERYETAKAALTAAVQGIDDDALQAQFVTLFAREHTTLGAIAPDIAGKDLDDVAFKLSDYKGKVVLLDFWGDW
ncbi:MAG: hypothetical protein R3F56_12550 [Planctomycetota bacterium]